MNAREQTTGVHPAQTRGNEISKRIRNWSQGRAGRFLLTQLTHTAITIAVLAALLLGAVRVGALNGVLAPVTAPAADGSFTTINYQGRLADNSGNPISGPITLQFALYDLDTGGSLLWGPETHPNIPVSDGLFSVRLGSQTAGGIPINVFDGGDVWLETIVEGETLSPREKLTAVPYAMMAGTVPDEAIGTDQIADGAVTSSKLDTHLCCGHTSTDGTGWISYQGPEKAIYIDVDTSACGFPTTPMYFTSLAGNSRHWLTTGATSIYFPSTNGFRVYVKSTFEDLDPTKADSLNWHLQWCGVKK